MKIYVDAEEELKEAYGVHESELTIGGFSFFPNSYACSAYERDSREPTPEELVQVYYNASTLL